MTDPSRRLVVMRHAQAESAGRTDADRRLTSEGRESAHEAGAWLAKLGVVPDGALVSSAQRTRETWELVCSAGGFDEQVASVDDALYSAGADSALDLVRQVGDEVHTLVMIGHNPTIGWVAMTLDDGTGAATERLATGYPAGTASVFEVEGSWSDLGEEGGRVTDVFIGHG